MIYVSISGFTNHNKKLSRFTRINTDIVLIENTMSGKFPLLIL
ncbi:hypothetical protein MTBPR1_30074 [Candidatus Terasakiella magnetica]|uniref:Uncharacterized protein n=1 Tax=Candidatus Terasakiella magnetica TaxID=1867952 RepID=A0A1C3RHM2_9PROT|nr:hypothetical protein MTBPR1_30074 [Candidatus Terasakiella magnetica]